MAKMRKVKLASGLEIEVGSGNVYKHLGFKNADAMLARARIVAEIVRIIRARRLTQTAAAKVLGLSQPKVSALLNGQFQGYSQERLIGLLNRLGCDVKIVVTPKPRNRAMGRAWRPSGRVAQGQTSLLAVERQQPEALPTAGPQGTEVTLVQGEDVPRPMPLGEHDERRIGEADLQLGVPREHILRGRDIARIERLELVSTPGDFIEEGGLGDASYMARYQVVEFGEHERREQQRRRGFGQSRYTLRVVTLAGVDRRKEPARIEQDHNSPKPASASSTRSASRGLPLLKSGRRGRGGALCAVTARSASRISSASLHPRAAAARASERFSSSGT